MSGVRTELHEAKIRQRLSAEDWQHSLRTAAVAVELAERFGVDTSKARLAGLLHDYARGIPKGDLVGVATGLGIEVDDVERQYPYLLHAEIGAKLARAELGIVDEEVLAAVANHTIGRAEMSSLEKIVYLADMIEPSREFERIDEVRALASKNLDDAFRLGYALSLLHLVERGKLIHPRTADVWNRLCERSG